MTPSPLPNGTWPPVLLAPMAGITDLPFRKLVAGFGAGLVVSEMIASHDMINARPGTREKAELGLEVAGTSVQLAGREAKPMADAARMVEAQGARMIDINMGCPAKKVTQGFSGSALMKAPDHALRLIEAVVNAVSVPVTLKTRLGWDEELMNAPMIAKRAEEAGIRMVTIHGRTRCQFYKGHANWRAISAVKQAVSIPVIANGDITGSGAAKTALEQSGADGVMVGRAVRGQPWLLAEIATELFGTRKPQIPRGADFAEMVAGHYEQMLGFYGAELGGRVARKHLGWYMDTCETPADLRRAVLTATTVGEIFRLLPDAMYFATPAKSAAA